MSEPQATQSPVDLKRFLDPVHPRDVLAEEAAKELIAFLNGWTRKFEMNESAFLYILSVPIHFTVRCMCLRERGVAGVQAPIHFDDSVLIPSKELVGFLASWCMKHKLTEVEYL